MTESTMYPPEILDPEDDDGTMPENVDRLREAVVGRRIVKAERGEMTVPEDDAWTRGRQALVLTLDDGRRVEMADTDDCCAYTELESFLLHPERVDHVITGVGTTGGYTVWHVYADLGDVLELKVGWSSGNLGYYGYGFDILVVD